MTLYKYCRRCGKRLEGTENRLRGYGETCFKKAQAEAQRVVLVETEPRGDAQRETKNLSEQIKKTPRPPHLEKTLTPTYKKPLLFRPHTPPIPPSEATPTA